MDTLKLSQLDTLKASLKGKIKNGAVVNGEIQLTLESKDLVETAKFLRDKPECAYTQLIDVCAVDYLGLRAKRFEIVVHLLSMQHNHRVRLKVPVSGLQTSVPSLSKVFSAAGWWEREIFDMFGLTFTGNNDMRRILTDYDFEGHPLLKDFPLTGHVQKRYDSVQGKVIEEPVHLPQAYRTFDTESPWMGVANAYARHHAQEDAGLNEESVAHE